MPEITMLEAIRQALYEEMERDAAVVMLGEDIGVYGGASFNNIGVEGASSSQGTGIGVEGIITGHTNTGYAGYFTNTDTSNSTNYGIVGKAGLNATSTGSNVGVYGEGDCWNCYGGYFTSTNGDGILAGVVPLGLVHVALPDHLVSRRVRRRG